MNIEKYLVLNKYILSLFGVNEFTLIDDIKNLAKDSRKKRMSF